MQRTSRQYYGPWVNSDNWVHHLLTRPFDAEPGGQMLYVIPELGITAVMTSDPSSPSPGSRYLRKQNALLENFIIPALGPSTS